MITTIAFIVPSNIRIENVFLGNSVVFAIVLTNKNIWAIINTVDMFENEK